MRLKEKKQFVKQMKQQSRRQISPDATSCLPLSNQTLVVLTEAVEGFAGGVATEGAAAEAHSARSADMSAKQALAESVLCKRY